MYKVAIQTEFRPALPVVFGAKDYRDFRDTLIEMDHILIATKIEQNFIWGCINSMNPPVPISQFQRKYNQLRLALRYSILLALTDDSYRVLARRVADSQLFQWFTSTAQIDGVRPASKSRIKRYEQMFSDGAITELIHTINMAIADKEGAQKLLYRETALRFDEIFADTTCVKANIHFPVDWILLRDCARTLIKAIILIRSHGLKHRINKPEDFLRNINKLCIEITHTRKKKNGKKMRKMVFRRMKKLMKIIAQHAENYSFLLETHQSETSWTEVQVQVVLDRIQNILDQLPAAVDQAHERIIGERRVANKDKIFSIYEPDIHVIVRGKSGAEVEFGNTLYLAEQDDGLIVDWELMREQAPGDNKLVKESIERISEKYGTPESYTGDRGFDGPDSRKDLDENNIFNAICPKSVVQFRKKLQDEHFCSLQKRRAATEARIGIFKNVYLGKPLRSNGFHNRKKRIEWCVLAHNLWKLARMAVQQREINLAEDAEAA